MMFAETPRHLPAARAGLRCMASAIVGLALACGDSNADRGAEHQPPVIEVGGDPAWQVGKQDGAPEEMFVGVTGGRRLSDGSVVVSVARGPELRRYGPDGSHQWSRGRAGDGPGEFREVELLHGCTDDDAVVAYDPQQFRISRFGAAGELLGTWGVPTDRNPPFRAACAADDRLIFHPWGPGPNAQEPGIVRWRVPVVWAGRDQSLHVLREDVPGPEKGLVDDSYFDRHWSRALVFAGSEEGVWIGSGDDYALELVGWDGAPLRELAWEGPDLTVTRERVDSLFERLAAAFGASDPTARNSFRAQSWPWWEDQLPDRLPAYERLLITDEGELWVGLWAESRIWRLPTDPGRAWLVFDRDGRVAREVRLPGNMSLLDAGEDWVLVVTRDELGVERVAVYETG